jgi:hypothetical protein
VAAGLISAIPGILNQPTGAVSTLAQRLPEASTFFLGYIVTKGLSVAGGALAQLGRLCAHYALTLLFGSTPRQNYKINLTMGTVAWGTLFPSMTLFTVGLGHQIHFWSGSI